MPLVYNREKKGLKIPNNAKGQTLHRKQMIGQRDPLTRHPHKNIYKAKTNNKRDIYDMNKL